MTDVEDGLLGISIESSGEEDTATNGAEKLPRDYQSPADFEAVKASYVAKVEVGNIHREIQFPLSKPVTKQQYQRVLHAIEELYFYGRFEEGKELAERVVEELGTGEGNGEWREVVRGYVGRCAKRVEEENEKREVSGYSKGCEV